MVAIFEVDMDKHQLVFVSVYVFIYRFDQLFNTDLSDISGNCTRVVSGVCVCVCV